MVLELK